MSALQEFEDQLRLSLAAQFGASVTVGSDGTNVGNPLIATLLPILLDIGGGLLLDCLGGDSEFGGILATIFDALRRRLIVNKALRTSDIPQEHRKKCRDALLATVDKMGRAKMEAVAKELQNPKIDWSAW